MLTLIPRRHLRQNYSNLIATYCTGDIRKKGVSNELLVVVDEGVGTGEEPVEPGEKEEDELLAGGRQEGGQKGRGEERRGEEVGGGGKEGKEEED